MDFNQIFSDGAKIYDSLPQSTQEAILNPTAKTLGEALEGAAIVVCSPLLILRTLSKALLHKFSNEIDQGINGIPQEDRDSSKFGLVIKAMEEARYQLDEDDIRKMYVNLIASTVDSRKNNSITPRFVTVISQFGKQDAQFLDILYSQQNQQLIYEYRRAVSKDNSGVTITHGLFKLDNGDLNSNYDLSVDTLSSLGVIKELEKDELASSHYRQKYHSIENALKDPTYIKPEFISAKNISSDIVRGHIMLTEFGKKLCQCIFGKNQNISDPVLIDDAIEATGSMSAHQVPTVNFDDSTNSSTPN